MEMHLNNNKRRRVYSPQPLDLIRVTFARKYLSFLAPAIIMKIKKSKSRDENGDGSELTKAMRQEVDMALALSAKGNAWSHALKDELHKNVNLGFALPEYHPYHETESPSSHATCCNSQSSSVVVEKEASKTLGKAPAHHAVLASSPVTEATEEDEEEEEIIRSRMKTLRALIPGGEEMEVEELLKELGSYIMCLDLQVNILKNIVASN